VKILVLGIGNLLFGDEGIGVHFINYMGEKYHFEGEHQLDLVDGGTLAQRLNLVGDRPHTMIMGVVPTVIEATEFSLSEGVADAVPVMEKTFIDHLKTLGIESIKKAEVDIQTILPNSFRNANNAYSV
jgi:hydrogenase maturation protease